MVALARPHWAFDAETARAFLANIGDVHLASIIPDGPIEGRYFGDNIDAAISWAASRNAHAGIYWSTNLVAPSVTTKPTKRDITAARFVHVDIDPPKDGGGFDRAQVLAKLEALRCPPSFVIDSGGGVQAFWRLDGPAANLDAIEGINAQVRDLFGADACQNIDRLMRLPGSINWPNAKKRERGRTPALARMLSDDDGTFYEPDELRATFPPAKPRAPDVAQDLVAAPVNHLTADDLGLSDFHPARMMIERPAGNDRSTDVYECACEMIRAGCTDAQIIGVLLNPANLVSAHCYAQKNPHRAAARALQAAHQRQRVEPSSEHGAAVAAAMGIGAPVDAQAPSAPTLTATPYRGRDPASIPPRPWVYGRYLLRKTVTAVIAPGGVGKSSLMAGTAVSLATGQPLLGVTVWDRPQRVWLWNLEDDGDELARQIEAACMRFDISSDDFSDRLFVDSGLDGARLCTAVQDGRGVTILRPVIEALVAELTANRIDVLIVDPFVSSHQVDENDNSKIDAIAKAWAEVATRAFCSIVLVHHAKKLEGKKVTSEASRGGSSLTSATRSTMVLNRMTEDEAKAFGIKESDRRRYFNVGDDKHNRSPAGLVDWYFMDSVRLGNGGMEGGDSVGVATPWSPPSSGDMTPEQVRKLQVEVSRGSWREDTRSPSWAGHAVSTVMNLDPKEDRVRIVRLLRWCIETGALVKVQREDETRRPRQFIEVGVLVDPTSAPVETTVAE